MDQRNIAPHIPEQVAPATLPMLIAEIGTVTTRLAMVDLVDGAYRLIARAETTSTLDAPNPDAMRAVRELIGTIEGITGRTLADATTADEPPYHLVMTTSAAGVASVAIMALTEASAHEAVNAARGIYSDIVHRFSLDEAGSSDEHWLSEQLTLLALTKPEAIVLAGGLEKGAVAPVERLAHFAGLLARSMRPIPWVLYAGNSTAAERVRAAAGDVTVVANLRPTATTNRLEPARAALRTFYATHHIPGVAGYDAFHTLLAARPTTVADSQAIMVRFLAERYDRRIVFLDTGAAHASGHVQADGHFTQVVLANHGIGAGATTLLQHVGDTAIARWLPYVTEHSGIANRLFNRAIHGSTSPVDGAELLLDYALLREALFKTLTALRAARPTLHYDLVVAAGAIAHTPQPGLAALALLDVLAMDTYYGTLAIDLYLDSLGLFAASGALAHLYPEAATSVLERDALNSGPLATLLIPQGAVVDGEAALDVELTSTKADGTSDTQRVTVLGGQIVRLPMPRNARGTLRVEPVAGVSYRRERTRSRSGIR